MTENPRLHVVMISLHTSPLEQPGQGDAGGLNVYVRNLSGALSQAGHRVTILTRRTNHLQQIEQLPEATRVLVVPVSAGPEEPVEKELLAPWVNHFASEGSRYLDGLEDDGLDLVLHSHYWLAGLAGQMMAAHHDVPLIHTMHTIAAVKNAYDETAPEPRERIEAEARIAFDSDCLIANTTVEAQELVEYCGADSQRVAVVRPGVNHRLFHPDGPSHWPANDAAIRVLFAGRFQEHKGPHLLVKALAELRRRGVLKPGNAHAPRVPILSVHFTGAQSGQAELDLPAMARELGVESWCSFSGPVSPGTLARYLRAATVLAMPSYSESFGLVALESQACGTPVLGHRVGGLTEAVADGLSGELVDSLDPSSWADRLQRVIEDPQRWHGYAQSSSRHAAQYSWDSMAAQMTRVYTQYSGRRVAICNSEA